MSATEQGDAETVRRLLMEQQVKPDTLATREGFGRSALSVAATYGQAYVVAELLRVRFQFQINAVFISIYFLSFYVIFEYSTIEHYLGR